MKKTILIFLVMLIVGALSITNAQETPNVTNIYNVSVPSYGGNCESNGADLLLCPDLIDQSSWNSYGLFNITNGNLTLVTVSSTIWKFNVGTPNLDDVASCHYYSGDFYCVVGQDTGTGNDTFGIVRLTGDYLTPTVVSTHPIIIAGDPTTQPSTGACDLKPETDEIYCWTNMAVDPVYNNMWKYDIGDVTWTELKNIHNPIRQSATISRPMAGSVCTFRTGTDEMWCAGGGEFSSSQFNYNITIYDVVLNTTSTIQNNGLDFIYDEDFSFTPLFCRWHLDVLYCYGLPDEGLTAQPDMWYYNATSDTQGWNTNINPAYFGLIGSIGDADYLISGFESNLGTLADEVWELQFSDSTPCQEDWQPYYILCSVFDNQTLLYNDTNQCGTFGDLPVENGTVSSCNYCTPLWQETSLDCVSGDSERDITYDYINTCCDDTGLPSDCTIPANTTESCIGVHTASDVGNVVIDFVMEFGIQLIAFAGVIALFGLYLWYKKRVGSLL